MTRILLAVLAIFVLQTTAQAQFKDPNAQVRDAKNFHAIHVGSAFDVYVTQGTEEAVAVSSSDKDFIQKIVVEVKNGVLLIGLEKGLRIRLGNKKLRAYVSFKQLDELNISGACNVMVEGEIKADNFKLDLSGASDLKGKLDVNKLSANMSGASDATLKGSANTLNIDLSGASTLKAFDLVTDYCDAEASGASNIRITVNKELKIRASGASDIDYKGNGVIKDVRTSGASSVAKAG